MDKKKVTRRVAIGAAVGTVAASPLIFRALRAKYYAEIPTSTHAAWDSTVGGTTTVRVDGRTIGPIDLPKMEITNSEDMEEYNKMASRIIREQTYKELAEYPEDKRQALVAEFVEKKIKRWEAEIDEIESRSLWELVSDGMDESQEEQLRNELAELNDEEKARYKQTLKSQMSEDLANWKGGEGQRKFEVHTYQELFAPPKPLTEEQQLQVDKQAAKQRLERLHNGAFEESMRRSLEKSFQRMVTSGTFPGGRAKQAVEQSLESAMKREREWAAQASNAS
ncbi:MAG: hypothetical protein HQ582_02755 [Planctomycetes bacterium]|nr:hypothetical protein [Planctomycetota bacterium]